MQQYFLHANIKLFQSLRSAWSEAAKASLQRPQAVLIHTLQYVRDVTATKVG